MSPDCKNQPSISQPLLLISFQFLASLYQVLHLLTPSSVTNKSPFAQNARATEQNVPSSKLTPSKEQVQNQPQLLSSPRPQHQNPYHRLQSAIQQPTPQISQTAPLQAPITQPTPSPLPRKKRSNSACLTSSSSIPGRMAAH